MTSEEQIQYWIRAAANDLPAAQSLFDSGRYDWCLFIGHLVLEKTLKSHVVKKTEETPPRVHDLRRLASMTSISFSKEQLTFLDTATKFNIEARYPDEKFAFARLCTKDFAEKNLLMIKEVYEWLLSLLKS